MNDNNEYSLRAPFAHPANWKVRKLRDVCSKIGSGATPTGGQANYLPSRENWALVRSQNVFDRRFDETGLAYITDEQAATLGGVVLQPEDVLLNITGDGVTFARSCLIPDSALPAVVNQHVSIIRPKPELLNPGFLLAYLTHPETKHYIEGFNAGGSRRAITKGHIESFNIPLPPLQVQQDIAHILGTLDDKIELNRRTNETLEAMARAIFKSWFVDFDIVRAKASGESPESICRRLGLTPELLALFPDSFQESGLGEIPSGWEVRGLDGIASYLNGLALQKFPADDEGPWLPVIKIAQLRAGHTKTADRASDTVPKDYVIQNGDVLFSWSGSLEVEIWCGGEGALNQHLFKVTSQQFPKWFYYLWTRSHLESFRLIAANKATTMGHIQRKHLSEAKVVVPDSLLIESMNSILAPIINQFIGNKLESSLLANTRDGLLPKLLSGELPLLLSEVEE